MITGIILITSSYRSSRVDGEHAGNDSGRKYEPNTTVTANATITASSERSTTAIEREYTISPALVAAVARRASDETINSYINRHGIHGLATALTHTIAREQGETTYHLVAEDLDMSPLEAKVILQALRPIVHEHFSLEDSGASLADVVDAENLDR